MGTLAAQREAMAASERAATAAALAQLQAHANHVAALAANERAQLVAAVAAAYAAVGAEPPSALTSAASYSSQADAVLARR